MRKTTLILGLTAASIAVTGIVSPTFAAREKPNREQRVERMIKRLDMNGDKKVSLEEVQARASDAFKNFDTNGDGQVSRDEIKAKRAAFREVRKELRGLKGKPESERAAAIEKVKAMGPMMLPGARKKAFDTADTDKNGSLSATEVTAQAEKMFKGRDKNGDGFLDAADFAKKI